MENLYLAFSRGLFDQCIKSILDYQRKTGQTNPDLDYLLLMSYIRGNYTDKAVYHAIGLYQLLFRFEPGSEIFQRYLNLLKGTNILQTGIQVIRELKELSEIGPDYSSIYQDVLQQVIIDLSDQQRQLIVFPMIWPIAFGDSIVLHQFIKQKKKENSQAAIMLIMPLNRPDLQYLAELNSSIDYLIDITLLPDQEKNRLSTLNLSNQRFLNVTLQECIIHSILDEIKASHINFQIEKTRYLPLLDRYKYNAGWRIWEKRAELFVKYGIELPKLCLQKEKKQKKITVHFREGDYGAESRNVKPQQSQELIDLLKTTYPTHEIVRLGDCSMTPMKNCRDLSQQNLSLQAQIKEIQESVLYLGSHSGPQHLAIACSDTPVICTHYTVAPECFNFNDQISKMSLEPVGKQVKALLYNKMYDQNNNLVLPNYEHKNVRVEQPVNSEIIEKVKQVIQG